MGRRQGGTITVRAGLVADEPLEDLDRVRVGEGGVGGAADLLGGERQVAARLGEPGQGLGACVIVRAEVDLQLTEELERFLEQHLPQRLELGSALQLGIGLDGVAESLHRLDGQDLAALGPPSVAVELDVLGGELGILAVELAVLPGEDRRETREDGQAECQQRDCARDQRPVPPHPSARPSGQRLVMGRDGLVGQPAPDIRRQVRRHRVPLRRTSRHRLETDGLERTRETGLDLSRREDLSSADLIEHLDDPLAPVGWLARQDRVEDRPQAEDVARRADLSGPALALFGAHESRRADDAHRRGVRAVVARARAGRQHLLIRPSGGLGGVEGLGQPPVDDQRLAVAAEHDVARLQVAVEDPAAVRVADRLADRHEAAEQLAQGERALGRVAGRTLDGVEGVDGILERIAADEPHGVARRAQVIRAHRIDRHDARVLEPARDLGLEQESASAVAVRRATGLEELERDMAIEPRVVRPEYLAQSARGVEPQVVKFDAGHRVSTVTLGLSFFRWRCQDEVRGTRPRREALRAGCHHGIGHPSADRSGRVGVSDRVGDSGDAARELVGKLGAGAAELLGRRSSAADGELTPTLEKVRQARVIAVDVRSHRSSPPAGAASGSSSMASSLIDAW